MFITTNTNKPLKLKIHSSAVLSVYCSKFHNLVYFYYSFTYKILGKDQKQYNIRVQIKRKTKQKKQIKPIIISNPFHIKSILIIVFEPPRIHLFVVKYASNQLTKNENINYNYIYWKCSVSKVNILNLLIGF